MSAKVLVVDPRWRRDDLLTCTTLLKSFTEEELCPPPRDAADLFMGVDMEWTTRKSAEEPQNVQSRVAVLQLATHMWTAVIRIGDLLDLSSGNVQSAFVTQREAADLVCCVRSVLVDRRTYKFGVGILQDKKKFETDFASHNLFCSSCIDLASMEQHLRTCHLIPELILDNERMPTSSSLKALAARWAGMHLEKDLKIITSDWASPTAALVLEQITYASNDAIASFRVAAAMFAAAVAADRALGSDPSAFLESLVDVPASRKGSSFKKASASSTNVSLSQEAVPAKLIRSADATYECRKESYYDNIECYDPAGVLLFTIDKRKADWYVHKKRLATVLRYSNASEGAIAAIQLTFTPDFNKFNDGHIRRDLEYFRQPKENKCVVCGKPDTVVRCAVVPLMYRKYFPATYVSHNSYDLLLVCPACFAQVNYYHNRERERIAVEYGFPLATNKRAKPLCEHSSTCGESNTAGTALFQFVSENRAIIHQVLKNACALCRALDAASKVTSCDDVSASSPKRPDERKTSRKACQDSAWIPEARCCELEAFLTQNAPRYVFSVDPEVSRTVRANPLTHEALKVIAGARLHDVLSRAVAETFPEMASTVASTAYVPTKKSPQSTDSNVPGGSGGALLDNHAAYVISEVVKKYPEGPDYGVGAFILRWRMLFLDTMKPKHLPLGWVPTDGILLPDGEECV